MKTAIFSPLFQSSRCLKMLQQWHQLEVSCIQTTWFFFRQVPRFLVFVSFLCCKAGGRACISYSSETCKNFLADVVSNTLPTGILLSTSQIYIPDAQFPPRCFSDSKPSWFLSKWVQNKVFHVNLQRNLEISQHSTSKHYVLSYAVATHRIQSCPCTFQSLYLLSSFPLA